MIGAISTALTGLLAASQKVATTANNVANATTPGYQALTTAQASAPEGGVRSSVLLKNPGDVNGYAPDVDLAEEAVNLKLAEISYKANLAVLKTAGELSDELLNTFDERA